MTKKKDPSDITETPPPVTAKPNVYQDVPPIQIGEADTGVSDLLTEDSKPSTSTANAPAAPGVREELE